MVDRQAAFSDHSRGRNLVDATSGNALGRGKSWAPATADNLPAEVQALAAYRAAADETTQLLVMGELAGVRWDLLADAAKGPSVWAAIARKMGPQALRMNLNTLVRHGVFESSSVVPTENHGGGPSSHNMVDYAADRIADAAEVARSRQFPYQHFAAHVNTDDQMPAKIKTALHKAAEIACENVPGLPGPVVIGLDTSGSMGCAVTGNRASHHGSSGATSKMRCVDVAALLKCLITGSRFESTGIDP